MVEVETMVRAQGRLGRTFYAKTFSAVGNGESRFPEAEYGKRLDELKRQQLRGEIKAFYVLREDEG